MKRTMFTCLLLLSTMGCGIDMGLETEAENGIQVTGTGELAATPDMAEVTFQITREGAEAATLKAELDAIVTRVLALTTTLNIAPEDVTAAAVSLYPRYRRDGDDRVQDGVTASRTVAVTLRALDDYGALIDGALQTGINGVSGVRLDVSSRDQLSRQALDAAIADASATAAQVAGGFNVPLGELLSVDVEAGYPTPLPVARMAMDASGGDFSAGQIQIRRSIRATFEIDDD